jgi:ketosteroid isomerase-like protein
MGHSETHARMHGHFNNREYDAIEASLAPGFLYEDLPRALTIKTSGEFTDYLAAWVAGFSDGAVQSATYLEGPDSSTATYHGRGHFDGTLVTPMGDIPGNGVFLDLPICEVLHYASDGRVLSGELYYDQLTLMTQLGLMPGAAAPAAEALESPTSVVRDLFAAMDRLDFAAIRPRLAPDACGIDEISKTWLRGSDQLDGYLRQLEGAVTAASTSLRDLDERITGDTALVTCWIDQDYVYDGNAVHVSAPTTVAMRRDGGSWKITLMHTVPVPEE